MVWQPQPRHLIQSIAQKQALYLKDTTDVITSSKRLNCLKPPFLSQWTSLVYTRAYHKRRLLPLYENNMKNFTTETCPARCRLKKVNPKPVEQPWVRKWLCLLETYLWQKRKRKYSVRVTLYPSFGKYFSLPPKNALCNEITGFAYLTLWKMVPYTEQEA